MSSLDIVIPIYNEEAVLPLLASRLREVFDTEAMGAAGLSSVRLVFVDDGSTDGGPALIEALSGSGPILLLRLSRNFGHQAAVTAGLAEATADFVAVMDADLQDPPEHILEMLKKMHEGFDVVYGVRRKRQEGMLIRTCYWLFYRLYRWLTPMEVPVDSGDFCVMSRRVIEQLNLLPETVRFPRGLRSWVGFSQVGLPYRRPERLAGTSKYDFRKLYELATDGITALSIRPLQLAQLLAFVYLVLTSLAAVPILVLLGLGRLEQPALWGLLLILLISNTVTLFCLYILGAYVGRTYFEAKGRPGFIIMERREHD